MVNGSGRERVGGTFVMVREQAVQPCNHLSVVAGINWGYSPSPFSGVPFPSRLAIQNCETGLHGICRGGG